MIIDVHTSKALTLGETPFAVVMTPNTAQGCRPISVKIQPNELAAIGRNGSSDRAADQPLAGGRATLAGHPEQEQRRSRP